MNDQKPESKPATSASLKASAELRSTDLLCLVWDMADALKAVKSALDKTWVGDGKGNKLKYIPDFYIGCDDNDCRQSLSKEEIKAILRTLRRAERIKRHNIRS
jgi:hypothetical protein